MTFNSAKSCLLILFSLCIGPVCAEEVAKTDNLAAPTPSENGYTINYNTVSIIEYIRFASKICNINFIYNDAELNFNVSVISDAPITSQNVMATLVQVLRINGMMLLEQDNNLVIHKSADVNQIATIVTDGKSQGKSPIVTRIFRLKNAKPESVAAIIRPMTSTGSLLEVSAETRQLILTDVTSNIDKVASLIEILDSPYTPLEIVNYDVLNNSPEFLIDLANQIMTPLSQGNPFLLVPQPLANSIFIVSTPELVERSMSILKTLDTPPKKSVIAQRKLGSENIFVYKTINRSAEIILSDLNDLADNLSKSGVSEGDLIDTIHTARSIHETNSIMFLGSPASIAKLKEFLTSIDVPSENAPAKASFFIFKPQHRPAKEMEQAILEMASNLKGSKGSSESLIETIESVKINASTNTLIFSGDEKTFPGIKDLLSTMDTPSGKTPPKAAAKNTFFVYKIRHAPAVDIESSLKNFAASLDQSNASDKELIESINSMKLIVETNSILFTGPDASLKRLQDLVPSFDEGISSPPISNQFFIYKPKYLKGDQLSKSLKEIADNLKSDRFADLALLQSLQSMKWVKMNNSLLFTGDAASIKKVEDLISTLDIPGASQAHPKPGYYIYKLQNTTGDVVEEDLDNLVKNFKESGMKDSNLIDAINNIRYVKETNSLLITGDPAAIEETKKLIGEYDYARTAKGAANSNFFMYKPQHLTAPQIQKSLLDVSSNLKRAELADPNLLSTIESSKYVESTNSLIFTGPQDALQKVQTLIKDIDIPPQRHAPIQHVGKTTFLLYKLKNASGPQIITSIKAMTSDLKKSGTSDKDFLLALQSVKYVKETNSLLFTGTEESLTKVEAFVEKFDVTGLAAAPQPKIEMPSTTGPSNFYIYKPVSLTGPDLEKIMDEFAENLKMGGLSDADLFNAITSMRWIDKTQSLVFTGTPKALDQIKQLLTSFDIPSNLPEGPVPASGEPSIQAIDNTSFLVYKLQFHKGDEIQGALRQIAKDLIISNAPVNQNLLNSINSIQWLEVTNSLLCSGDQETLTRLRELIKNLDIPLKQVFIEMLVIETQLTNALQFGLEWGGKYKYRNKFQGSINNTLPQLSTDSTCTPDSTMQELNNYIPTNPPKTLTNLIPFGCGFDLGIIGQVIKHNGSTFLTLGSLLSALQSDDETSVVLTPKIITQDGKTTTLFVGQNVPFVGSFVNNQGQTTVQTSNLEYRDIGLNLTITPVLGNSDIVTLDISLDRTQTLGDVTGSALNFSNTSAQGITTSRTTMQTTVHVPDKNFLILSGFVNNSNAKSKAGIPCLGGLPVIGAAFSKDNDTISNTNIVIFLRPHIINSLDDMRQVTANQEEAFRDQQGTPYLMKQFDEAMELIKSVDDE